MKIQTHKLIILFIVFTVVIAVVILGRAVLFEQFSGAVSSQEEKKLPDKNFTHPPEKPHDPNALYFNFDQLAHLYRVPGEFTYRLTGDQYGFDALSFIITETHPGGGPGLHVHDVEEAHVLIEGTVQYRIGDSTFTVQTPYVAKVPAGVPHTFINAGSKMFNLIAVFPSKHPTTKRIGPNPLVRVAPQE